ARSPRGKAAPGLEAERANLHAAAEHAADRACFPHAFALPAAMSGFLANRGHWDQSAALHQGALAAACRAGDRLGEADTLARLGALQREMGDYPAAAASLAQAAAIYGDARARPRRGRTPRPRRRPLGRLGFLQARPATSTPAAASHQAALALARSASNRPVEAEALVSLGMVQQLTGDHPAAAASLQQALELFGDIGNLSGQAY